MRILLTGATGQLGSWIVRGWRDADGTLLGWSSSGGSAPGLKSRPVDLADAGAVAHALDEDDPDVIIHAAAVSKPDLVLRDPANGWAVNTRGTQLLCDWCAARRRRLIFTSTDLVFDGTRGQYTEDERPSPLVEYGRTKAVAEALVRELPGGLVARVCLLYGPSLNGKATFFDDAMAALGRGERRAFFQDEYRTPLDYPTAARALIALAHGDLAGTVHLAGPERVSRLELFRRLATALGLDPALAVGSRLADVAASEPRPVDVSLRSERLASMLPDLVRPTIEEAARGW